MSNKILYKTIIEKPNPFDLGLLHSEFKNSSIGDLIESTQDNGDVIFVWSNVPLNETQFNTIVSIAQNHSPHVPSAIEIKAQEIIKSNDYHKTREELRLMITEPFDNLSDEEKEICALYCLYDDATIIGYYISTGLDLSSAEIKHLVTRANDINRASISCSNRANSAIIKYISIKYMEEDDAATFIDAIRNFIVDYKMIAHLGLNYGHSRDGVMDYIESTNAYIGAGLSTYNFRAGTTYEQCRDELKNFLVYGIEPTEFTQFSTT